MRTDLRVRCPKCGYTDVKRVSRNRVPRTWRNYWCRILAVPSYRCPECRTKFFSLGHLHKEAAEPGAASHPS